MYHLKYIITATAAGPQSNNVNPNALGGVARFKKNQLMPQ